MWFEFIVPIVLTINSSRWYVVRWPKVSYVVQSSACVLLSCGIFVISPSFESKNFAKFENKYFAKNFAKFESKNFAKFESKNFAIFESKNFAKFERKNFAKFESKNFAKFESKNFAKIFYAEGFYWSSKLSI